MADERAHGKSEGNVISFGINERYDCKLWVEYAVKRFGEHTDVFLAGVSMGEELFKACKAKKERVLIEGADHANSAMVDYAAYEKAVLRFIEQS